MRIRSLHGYFIFKERAAGDVSRFMQIYPALSIVPMPDDYYTFEALASAPTHVIKGDTYLGAVSTVTFEGKPWEIMRANNLVFDFTIDEVVNITTVTKRLEIQRSANYFLSPGLILPGSVTDDGSRVTDYAAWYLDRRFKYSEVTYE